MNAMLASPQRVDRGVPRSRDRLAGRISVLGEQGIAAQLTWRRGSHADSRDADKLFSSLCGKGYRAFAICGGQGGRRIEAFNPALGDVVLTPGQAQGWEDCGMAAWEASIADGRALLRSLRTFLSRRKPGPREAAARAQAGGLRGERLALCLLLNMLDQAQRRGLRETGSLRLRGGATGSAYHLRAGNGTAIDQLDEHGQVLYTLRIPAQCALPMHAALLAHMLHLQDPESEHAYLSGAEIVAPGSQA